MIESRVPTPPRPFWRTALPHAAAIAVLLGLTAWWSPSTFPTDQLMMELGIFAKEFAAAPLYIAAGAAGMARDWRAFRRCAAAALGVTMLSLAPELS